MNEFQKPKKNLATYAIIVLVGIFILAAVAQVFNTTKPLNISVNKEDIVISGSENIVLKRSSITEMKLLNEAPKVLSNNVGGEMLGKITGNVTLESFGATNCFVEKSNDNVIFIKAAGNQYLLGLKTDNQTDKIFNKIKIK